MKRFVVFILIWSQYSIAVVHTIKVPKDKGYSASMKLIRTDGQFNYFQVSEHEYQVIMDAEKLFKESKGEQPPPSSLQMKMQDQVGVEKTRGK